MADPKQLNTLARYLKTSSQLVLEEHSHCEVPAGCGGAVLRWLHAGREVPVELRVFARTKDRDVSLDGAVVTTTRTLLARGEHVLALRLVAPRGGALFAVALTVRYAGKAAGPGAGFQVVTADDGTWRADGGDPEDARWRDDPYDDSTWMPLREAPLPALDERAGEKWQWETVSREGATLLGLPGHAGVLRVRKRFRIPLADEAGGGA